MNGQKRNFFRNFKNDENERYLYLEIAEFSDPTLYLQNNQYKISDRLICNRFRFETKKISILPRGVRIEPFFKNLPL